MAETAGFLAERLAKAAAVPADQRSPDVRAFIETCRLQAELMEELGHPDMASVMESGNSFFGQWLAAPALKLGRSHLVSPGVPLLYAPELHYLATNSLYNRTSFASTGTLPSDLCHELAELLEGDPGLEAFAILAAGLPGVKNRPGLGQRRV